MVSRLILILAFLFSFVEASNYLFDAAVEDNNLILEFQKPAKAVKVSFQKGTTLKYFFDFKGVKLKSKELLKALEYSLPVKKIDFLQNKDTFRVIVDSTISYNAKVYKNGKSTYKISLPHQSKPFSKLKDKISNLFSSIKTQRKEDDSLYETTFKKNYTIIIDPGHGGKDAGAISPDNRRYKEKDAVLRIALKLKRHLQNMGYKVYMTRSRDKFVKLPSRTHFANIKKGDLFISIHANSIRGNRRKRARIKGIETYYLSPAKSKRARMVAEKENIAEFKNTYKKEMKLFLKTLTRSKIILSQKLALDVQSNMVKNLRRKYKGVVNGGVKPAPFWVLIGAEMPAVLIETGYISNPRERARLFNSYYQDKLAEGIAKGVVRFLENREKEME
jgi:N-acetylmuramoyl-L-alanine amidase